MDSTVALVTVASRGLGRGIALGLGAAGWTVWVTGRSSRTSRPASHLPGTVEETAEAVTAAGGQGIAARPAARPARRPPGPPPARPAARSRGNLSGVAGIVLTDTDRGVRTWLYVV